MTVPEADEWGNMTVIGSKELKKMVSPMDSLVGYYLIIEGQYVNDGNQWNAGVVVTTNNWNYYLSKGISGWGDDDHHDTFYGTPMCYELTEEMSDALLNGGLTISQGNCMEVTKIYFAKSYTLYENTDGKNGDFFLTAEEVADKLKNSTTSLAGYTVKLTMLPTENLKDKGFQVILESTTSKMRIVGVGDDGKYGQWMNEGTTTYSTTLTEEQSASLLEEGLHTWCTKTEGVGITKIEIIAAK